MSGNKHSFFASSVASYEDRDPPTYKEKVFHASNADNRKSNILHHGYMNKWEDVDVYHLNYVLDDVTYVMIVLVTSKLYK